MHRTNRLQKILSHKALEQVSPSAGFESARNMEVARMGRQDDNSCVGELAANGADRIDTAHLRHLQIHERDVRTMFSELFERLTSVRSFPNQLHVRLSVDQHSNA